jgi:acetolactate synthase-1/2/3 large subunit
MNFGVVGIAGRRSANALIYNCDNLIVLGTHLPLPLTGALTQKWCSQAIKTIVNIDSHELEVTRLNFNYKFSLDASIFIDQLCSIGGDKTPKPSQEWRRFCHDLAQVCEPSFTPPSPFIDQYKFLKILSDHLHQHDVVTIDGGGTINASAFTTLRPYSSTSLIMSSGMCAMGSGIPEAIGACMSCKSSGARFILLIGDGSLQFNIQELATVHFLKIPLKIFVINNGGYASMRTWQNNFFEGRYIGSTDDTGAKPLNFERVAFAFGIDYVKIENIKDYLAKMPEITSTKIPQLIEVMCKSDQELHLPMEIDKV